MGFHFPGSRGRRVDPGAPAAEYSLLHPLARFFGTSSRPSRVATQYHPRPVLFLLVTYLSPQSWPWPPRPHRPHHASIRHAMRFASNPLGPPLWAVHSGRLAGPSPSIPLNLDLREALFAVSSFGNGFVCFCEARISFPNVKTGCVLLCESV